VALEFVFEYTGNNDFFEYLLHFYAKNYEYDLKQEGFNYIFKIQGSNEELSSFCEKLNGISNSVFLGKFDVKACEDFENKIKKDLSSFAKFPYITHLNSNAYCQNKSFSANEWGVFSSVELSFDKKNFKFVDEENFKDSIEKALNILKQGEKIWLKNKKGTYELSLFNDDFTQSDFLMPCDIKAINSIFVCASENLKLLASLEKPLMKLKLNAIFRKNHNLDFQEFKLKLSEDLFTFALNTELFAQNYKFLSFKKLQNQEDDFELLNLDGKIIILRGFDFIEQRAKELIFQKEDKNLARLSYILSLFSEKSLLLELSKDYDDILLANQSANLLKLKLPKSSKELYEQINQDPVGARLLENYKKEFSLLNEEFKLKNNFFSLFCILGRILNSDENFLLAGEKLLELAQNSKLVRGVKIDYKLDEKGNLDHTKTLRSAMSFMLAGVENVNIAYGALESLALFLRDLNDDLISKKQSECAIITGSLFENKALAKNTLKHLKNCKLSNVPLRI